MSKLTSRDLPSLPLHTLCGPEREVRVAEYVEGDFAAGKPDAWRVTLSCGHVDVWPYPQDGVLAFRRPQVGEVLNCLRCRL